MTAAELIALLRSRPIACGRLGVQFAAGCCGTPMVATQCLSLLENDAELWTGHFLNWLTGAAVNEFVRRGWRMPLPASGGWGCPDRNGGGKTLLEALLAAIEASEETTT